MLQTVEFVRNLILDGRRLFLAGSAQALAQLPRGDWIGGSICCFMDRDGGLCSEDRIFVTEVPLQATQIEIREYREDSLPQLYSDAPGNGFTFLLVPSEAPFLQTFARDASRSDGFLIKPVVGWVTGVPLNEAETSRAIVVNGQTLQTSSGFALAMHVSLPSNQVAELSIINIFEPGDGDAITFDRSSFRVSECLVNGQRTNLASYIKSRGLDTRLPLTADYCGNTVNVAIRHLDPKDETVSFFGTVRPTVVYRFAKPVPDYAAAFARAIPQQADAVFSCNCVLNYLYGELEGKRTGTIAGPMTFGEIAHILLSQTLVQLRIRTLGVHTPC